MTDQTVADPPVQYTRQGQQQFNGMAITAFVVVFFASVVGLAFGYVALNQIKQTHERGRGLALAAVVLGWVGTIGLLVLIAVIVAGSWVFKIY